MQRTMNRIACGLVICLLACSMGFGQGGTAVEVLADRAIGLPPLNRVLARELISRTRVAKLLAGYRDHPPAKLDAICDVLIAL